MLSIAEALDDPALFAPGSPDHRGTRGAPSGRIRPVDELAPAEPFCLACQARSAAQARPRAWGYRWSSGRLKADRG